MKSGENLLKTENISAKDDCDTPWKDILDNYFFEFLEFFFPEVYRDIDRSRGYRFLEWKEFEKSGNPFAVEVMAHLKSIETKKNRNRRRYWKLYL